MELQKFEILKGTYDVPDWFVKEKEKVVKRRKEIEKVTGIVGLPTIESKSSETETMMKMDKLRIAILKNPKIKHLLDANANFNQYLWERVRYECWDTFGIEDFLRYDPKNKKMLVIIKKKPVLPQKII